MPLFRPNDIRIAAHLSALLVAALGPRLACATLGEPEITVQSDVAQLRASIKSSEDRVGFRVHEIQLPGGTLLREFVAPDGNVFAVAWNGPTKPDLRQALGKYFDIYASAPRATPKDRRHMNIQQGISSYRAAAICVRSPVGRTWPAPCPAVSISENCTDGLHARLASRPWRRHLRVGHLLRWRGRWRHYPNSAAAWAHRQHGQRGRRSRPLGQQRQHVIHLG